MHALQSFGCAWVVVAVLVLTALAAWQEAAAVERERRRIAERADQAEQQIVDIARQAEDAMRAALRHHRRRPSYRHVRLRRPPGGDR